MKPVLYLFCLFFISPLSAQISPYYYPVSGESAALSSIQTYDDRVAVAGWLDTGESGRQALLLLLPGEKDQQPIDHVFGDGFDDEARALIETPDGNLLLAGVAGHKVGRSAWLLKTNRQGEILWQWKEPDLTQNSAFYGLIQFENGEVIAIGEKNGRAFVVAARPVPGAQLRTWSLPDYPMSVARAVAQGPAGKIAITGVGEKSDKKPEVFVLELDTQFKKQGTTRTYGGATKPGEFGSDITYDAENRRYVVALGNDGVQESSKAQVLLATPTTVQAFDPFKTQRFKNTAHAVLPLPGGRWLLAGATNNLGNVYGKFRPESIISNLKSAQKDEPLKLPRISDGQLYDAVLMHNGSIWLVGSARNPNGKPGDKYRAFAIRLEGEKLPPAPSNLNVTGIRFGEAGGNDTLNAGESAQIDFKVKKADNKPLWGVYAQVELSGNTWGVRHSKTVYFDHLQNDTAEVTLSVPIAGETYLASGETNVSIELIDARGNSLARPFEQTLTTKADPPPKLSIRFLLRDSMLVPREQDVPVRVCVRNDGEGIARNIRLDINPPYLVQLRSEPFALRDTLLPGDSVCYEARLKVSYLYPAEWFTVYAKASETRNYYVSVAYQQLTLRVSSFFEVLPSGESKPVYFDHIEREMRKGGPNAPFPTPEPYDKNEFTIKWSYLPDAKLDSAVRDSLEKKAKGLSSFHEPEIMLKAEIWHNTGHHYDVSFYRNSIRLNRQESKGKKDTILFYTNSNFGDSLLANGHYFFFKKVDLAEGSNAFTIEVKENNKTMEKSSPFNVNYTPPKIHYFIFGIPDLRNKTDREKLTTPPRNAALIKSFIDKNVTEKKLMYLRPGFSVVDTSMNGTTRIKLWDSFSHYLTDSISDIQPQDYFILFISGHGTITNNKKFELICSDEIGNVNNLRYGFEKNMLNEITSSNLRRVYMFLDLCHSGQLQISQTLSTDTLHPLTASPERFYIFPSTRPGQKAYELDSFSIFTTALMEALGNKPIVHCNDFGPPDFNGDGLLTVDELDRYLQHRIPILLKCRQNQLLQSGEYTEDEIKKMNQEYPIQPESRFFPPAFIRFK